MFLNARTHAAIKKAADGIKAELQAITLFDWMLSAVLVVVTNALLYAAFVKIEPGPDWRALIGNKSDDND